ncbi:tRNA 2-thiouridine(34) synthase MnmA [Bengtsoniella intestinalis]|uniref:tRNA 2-thiouridine(34) synthase MnmA n=1 Tax=Bengtsoniella intestinalis TaxID=3073143 RepID=UPI00391EF712
MNQKIVYVAMSGGVDSSAAVVLLLRQGYEVRGVTLKLHQYRDRPGLCGSTEDIEAAKAVAASMGIEHTVLDYTKEFQANVMDKFVAEYEKGNTPNPCIDCNRTIKFGALMDWALSQGGDYLATGHYAHVCEQDGVFQLRRGKDHRKDQSYMLYQLNQFQLSHLLLPLWDYEKPVIRDMAAEAGLSNAQKPDSQDICFVPDGDYTAFLQEYGKLMLEEGDFVDKTGAVLGRHKGQACYTKGQRRGLGVSAATPLYVVSKCGNQVVLGSNEDLFATTLHAGNPFWTQEPMVHGRVTAKTRYSQNEALATVDLLDDGTLRVVFDSPQRAMTPGQAVVLYQGDVVIGGATILEG